MVERRCFDKGIPCSAEMGGNDAAIVLEDADLPRTVAGLTHWALQNAGQSCGAVEVVYADSRIATELVERLADAFRRLRRPTRPGAPGSLAPLAFAAQLAQVRAQLDDAVAKGATLVVGGDVDGNYLTPAVLSGCDESMAIVTEESFGPVLPVVTVDGPADAIRRVNAGKYGLTASLWTRDIERAERLAEELDVGTVTVNNHSFTGAIVDLPWSGRRDSGRGIANSTWALSTFARPKAVVIDRSTSVEPYWMPFDERLEALGELLADAQLGKVTRAYKIPLLLAARVRTVKAFFGVE
jgi:acyl-CoA reductase-like NAD-dependent aldehyde dehydrogenase